MDKILKIKLLFMLFVMFATIYNYEQVINLSKYSIYTYTDSKLMIASICFGVIVSISIYNFMFFIYLRSRQHLYYSLAQLFTFFFLINLDILFIKPFDEIFAFKSFFLFDISQIFMLFFFLMFAKEFFYSYHNNKLNKLIEIILYISAFDLFLALIFHYNVITKFIPIFVFIWLVLSEARRLIDNRDMPFNYILFGWGIVLFVVTLEYIGFVNYTGIIFPFLHVAMAIDSIVLSMAISYRFKLLEDDRQVQQGLLLQQSRMASMGEMISIIAHQWRQPLNFLSFSFMNVRKNYTNKEKTMEIIAKASEQLQYMSRTIENFSNFYNPSKSKDSFNVSSACKNIINISYDMPYLQIITKKDFVFYGNQNELEQVLLNIVNNAKEMMATREVKEPCILIVIKENIITIEDNAGGIELKNIHKIFDPYFSTKSKNDGIGLYIAKIIIEKEMGGNLKVVSKGGKTRFCIDLTQ